MTFLRPELAVWWQILPLLVACWALRYQYVTRMRARTPVAARFASLSRRSSWRREAVVLVLMLITAGSMVFALP